MEKDIPMGVRTCFIISNQAGALMWVFEKVARKHID